jgi:2-haloacid dehalogenase
MASHDLHTPGIYKDFASVTRASLHHALAESGHSQSLSESDIDSLMSAYNRLESFPDVSSALETLKSSLRIHPYIFTNGSPSMVSASVHFSPSLSPWENTFRGIITVDAVQVYKPCPKAYHHLALSVGRTGTGRRDMEGIWLVSANPFDVVGARACGMEAVWVDREGRGWEDGLGMLVGAEEGGGGPTVVVRGVDEAVMEIRKRVEVR